MVKQITLLDAPSNLGLSPPDEGAIPGCYKAPGALRDNDLLARLDAVDGGVITPPRYYSQWKPGDGVRNAKAISGYTKKLAGRIEPLLYKGFPLVLGGDCSILLGSMFALRRRGRFGLAFLDGHDDFRHAGNSPHVGAAAGEDLALATGRGEQLLTNIDGLSPYVADDDIAVIGARERESFSAVDAGIRVVSSEKVNHSGVADTLNIARDVLIRDDLDGFWIHVDVDVLDPEYVSAVDSPDSGGLTPKTLTQILSGLLNFPGVAGMELTVFDPDLDPTGEQAELVTNLLVNVFA